MKLKSGEVDESNLMQFDCPTLVNILNRALAEYNRAVSRQPVTISENKNDYIFCTSCGKKIPRESKFCTECGAKNTYIYK